MKTLLQHHSFYEKQPQPEEIEDTTLINNSEWSINDDFYQFYSKFLGVTEVIH